MVAGSGRRLLIAALGIGLLSVCHLDRSLSLSCHPERNEVESKGLARRIQSPALELAPSNRCVPDKCHRIPTAPRPISHRVCSGTVRRYFSRDRQALTSTLRTQRRRAIWKFGFRASILFRISHFGLRTYPTLPHKPCRLTPALNRGKGTIQRSIALRV